jgi:hypothetical protein
MAMDGQRGEAIDNRHRQIMGSVLHARPQRLSRPLIEAPPQIRAPQVDRAIRGLTVQRQQRPIADGTLELQARGVERMMHRVARHGVSQLEGEHFPCGQGRAGTLQFNPRHGEIAETCHCSNAIIPGSLSCEVVSHSSNSGAGRSPSSARK